MDKVDFMLMLFQRFIGDYAFDQVHKAAMDTFWQNIKRKTVFMALSLWDSSDSDPNFTRGEIRGTPVNQY